MIGDITKLDEELFHNIVSLVPHGFLSALVEMIFLVHLIPFNQLIKG